MRKSLTLVMAAVVSIVAADVAVAQPRPYHDVYPPQAQQQDARRGQSYYYNGRWISQDDWRRRSNERDRWARSYQRRRNDRNRDDSSALIAGIIGFALGAAIVGSQQQAEHARTADERWDDYCAKKYRSYDRRSRTYMGYDGLRHYCQ